LKSNNSRPYRVEHDACCRVGGAHEDVSAVAPGGVVDCYVAQRDVVVDAIWKSEGGGRGGGGGVSLCDVLGGDRVTSQRRVYGRRGEGAD
jgi:hypothetical protein